MSTRPHRDTAVTNLDPLVDRLVQSYERGPRSMVFQSEYALPRVSEVVECFRLVRALVFPGYVELPEPGTSVREFVRVKLQQLRERLAEQLFLERYHRCRMRDELGPRPDCSMVREEAAHIAQQVLERIPSLRESLAEDVGAHFEADPAATGLDEVIFCYPGVFAVSAYRMAHELHTLGAPLLARIITEHAHERTGVDIHPGARIGHSFFIDHGTGIVIGKTTVIGDRVRIYQGVTLGALSLGRPPDQREKKRHPTIEDEVIIYANATILGGETVIGKRAVIGGNCWVTKSVPPGARVSVGSSGLEVRQSPVSPSA
jgi:serine O-acetyltransferase